MAKADTRLTDRFSWDVDEVEIDTPIVETTKKSCCN